MTSNKYDDLFSEADAAFDATYQNELAELKGMSKEEITAVCPDTTAEKTYMALIALVEKASKQNLSQAQLIERIKALGEIGIKLAMKVPSFAKLL
ncbi:hypothetical protein EO244_07615 [Ancylomarina salipaludis]|uniref:Uncharacterized protein n=1 Tax=Ancylomarina salipaludis TaxID=2501299 RepID=A0A4Q1JMI4_9BACT|nr:hypothetical protein [Ancylomarina salipaludis]RXQ95721.1 hypothetical protein EO244_07615 [Ancylomarina salipaludis]